MENGHYGRRHTFDNLERMITLLQSEIDEISPRCGQQPADHLTALLEKPRCLQSDVVCGGICERDEGKLNRMFDFTLLKVIDFFLIT